MSDKKRKAATTPKPAAGIEPALVLKRILIPIDFSKVSLAALRYAVPFAERFGAALYLIHVVEPAPFMSGIKEVPIALSDREVAEKALAELTSLAHRVVKPPVLAKPLVRTGKAHHEIVQAARELRIDLVILTTHGYTGLKHTLLGSTAERVVQHAPCPVLVVRETPK